MTDKTIHSHSALVNHTADSPSSISKRGPQIGEAALDLQQFCSTDPFRSYLHKPFSFGKYSYATNGHIMVRIPRLADIPEQTKKGDWDRPLAGIDKAAFSPLQHTPIPALPEGEKVDCDVCDGRGTEHNCPDCECPCGFCSGSGETTNAPEVSTTIRERIYNLRYVSQILALPGIELAVKTSAEMPLLFRFTGGVGAMMPRRRECDEHVLIEATGAAER